MDLFNLFTFFIVGFLAQMIDGALGMAYGVSSNTFLLSLGIPPATASASVHLAEVFTTLVSGISHFKLGNVDKTLLKKLIIPGIIGGVLGAYVLIFVPGKLIKPFVAIYLLIMGIRITYKAIKRVKKYTPVKGKVLTILGMVGGFFDAIGGGGWGPIVTSTLVSNGHNPRFTIGTVNTAEFFVTIAEVVAFLTMISIMDLEVILGLILGGCLAAPLAAIICKKIPTKIMMFVVGLLVSVLSIRTILLAVL